MIPVAGLPAGAGMEMGMAVVVPANPDPSAVPVPVAAYPEEFRARGGRNVFENGGGRSLRGDHLAGRGRGDRLCRIVALDPDPSVSAGDPLAGDPCVPGPGDAVPVPVEPLPALMAPHPVAADPDVAGARILRDDFHALGRRLAADNDLGSADVDSDVKSGAHGHGGCAKRQGKEGQVCNLHNDKSRLLPH